MIKHSNQHLKTVKTTPSSKPLVFNFTKIPKLFVPKSKSRMRKLKDAKERGKAHLPVWAIVKLYTTPSEVTSNRRVKSKQSVLLFSHCQTVDVSECCLVFLVKWNVIKTYFVLYSKVVRPLRILTSRFWSDFMATPQIVAVSNSYRQHHQEDSKYQDHNVNCCNHISQKRDNQTKNQSYCCSTCCCFVLSSDEVASPANYPQQPHTEHLNRRRNIKGQKENYKTIHKAKEVNEKQRTMDINRNGNLRNRVSGGFLLVCLPFLVFCWVYAYSFNWW